MTERLATDLKVAEDEEEEGGGGREKTDYDGEGMAKKYADARRTSGGIYSSNTLSWHWRRWEMWTSKSGREDDC